LGSNPKKSGAKNLGGKFSGGNFEKKRGGIFGAQRFLKGPPGVKDA